MKSTVVVLMACISIASAQPNVYVWTNSGAPAEIMSIPADLTNAVQISGGAAHALALCADGRVLAWGKTNSGQLNVPTNFCAPVEQVCAGSNFSVALLNDGTVRLWGQLWDEDIYVDANIAAITNGAMIAVTSTNLHVLMSDGTIATFPYGNWNSPATPWSGFTNASYIVSSGNNSWVVLDNDGTLHNGMSGSKVSSNAVSVFALSVQANQSAVARSTDQMVNYWNQTTGGGGTTPADQTNIVALSIGCPNCILSLDAAGNVKRVIGIGITVPTNLPPFSAISAGNKYGIGILK